MLRTTSKAAGQPLVRSVSSVAFAVAGDEAFGRTIGIAADWLSGINAAVPEHARDGEPFEVGGGGEHPARAVRVDFEGGRMWSATVDNPCSTVLGRTWVTELTVGENSSGVHFGARLLNVTRRDDEPFAGSIPGVVRRVVAELPCGADGTGLADVAHQIRDARALEAFLELLSDPERRLPVVAVADGNVHPRYADPDHLARRLAGAAHVFAIGFDESWGMTRALGRQLSVFDGAARIYAPGFDEESDPFEHPLWVTWPNRTYNDAATGVVNRVLSLGLSRGTSGHPRFEAVRQTAAALQLAVARPEASDLEMLRLYEEENRRLVAQLEELRSEQNQWLEDAERERSTASRMESELKADVARQRIQNGALRTALRAGATSTSREPLTDLERFGEWAERNLSAAIWFAPKSLKAAERGQFRDPALLGEALYTLDELYVEMRRHPGEDRRRAFQQRLTELGCENTPCFTQRNDIQRFPEYAVTYRNERFWCDWHVKCGGGTDPQQMFRIYYHWHEEEQVLLIGHLPSHLANNQTN